MSLAQDRAAGSARTPAAAEPAGTVAAKATHLRLRSTRQRSTLHRLAVLEVFTAEPEHRFTADAVAGRLLQHGNWITMPTIYNTLRLLIAQDLVDRSDADGGRSVFWLRQGSGRALHQIVCRSCQHSFAPHDAELAGHIEDLCAQHGLSVGEPAVLVQIRCGPCQERDKPQQPRRRHAIRGDAQAQNTRRLDADQAPALLQRAALRGTRCQVAVLRVFLQAPQLRHTAEDVVQQLQALRADMSLGTLYRALQSLVEARLLEKAWSQGRHVFWANAGEQDGPHRIVCRSCHSGLSTGDARLGHLVGALCARFGVALPQQPLRIQIRCQACAEENRPTASSLFGPVQGPSPTAHGFPR